MKKTGYILRLFAVIALGALGLPALAETKPIEVPLRYPTTLLDRPLDEANLYINYRSGMRKCGFFAATGNPFVPYQPISFSERKPDFDIGDNISIEAEYTYILGQDNITSTFGFTSFFRLWSNCSGALKMSREMEAEIWEWATDALTQLSTASFATPDSLQLYSGYAELHLCELVPYAEVFKETIITMARIDGIDGEYGVGFGVSMSQYPEHPFCETGIIR